MWILRSLVVLSITVTLASCGASSDCKSACDKLSTCALKSAGLSCNSDCSQGPCAACVNDRPCQEIKAGLCAPECPGVSFTNK